MWNSFFDLMNNTVSLIGRAQQANLVAATRSLELATNSYARMWGVQPEQVVDPDRRFEDRAWQDNPYADLMKQAYLITAQWMDGMADSLEPIDANIHKRTKFWTQQLADAFSPTNFAATNPVVWQEIARTGGANLVEGFQNLLEDLQRGKISQVQEGAFEVGKDLAITSGKVVFRNELIELIQYSPTTEQVYELPLLAIPPWINKYYIMDMRPENSMYKHLLDAGFTLFTISWKNPDQFVLDLGWDEYMGLGPLAALRVIKSITKAKKINTVGYCLGGIIQQTTLAYMAKKGDRTVNSATFFATHQDFTQAGDITVFIDDLQVKFLEWLMSASGGSLDGRNMAATFNMLRANDLLWNYVVHNYLLGKQPPAFDLLYWNSDGTRVPGKLHSFFLREFFLKNKLMEPNGIQVKGEGVDLRLIETPSYTVACTGDHIVPWEGTFKMRGLHGGPLRFVLSSGGHIAGIINPPAKSRREYWTNDDETQDPQAWLQSAENHAGSWWVDWIPWLQERSGKKVDPPKMGNRVYKPLMDAPGIYVLEK
ncbi:MAG TPA: class I poly(R)-hydroxyalkanoic acid synthase [Anaerolineales bacterium]|nr:class I poly(R)-hydroxyalkanoic acid synthase [Anaerolineales bacterium]